jgi:hypothetical protein
MGHRGFGETARSASIRGVVNDALAVYFLDATIAARWCAAQRVEVFRDARVAVREDEPWIARHQRRLPSRSCGPGRRGVRPVVHDWIVEKLREAEPEKRSLGFIF